MNQALQVSNQELQLLKQNWEDAFRNIPVKSNMTPMEVVALQAPAISLLNRGEAGPMNGILVFGHALVSVIEFLGCDWKERQCEEVASMLFSEYHYWSFAELKHFTLKVKKGDFGKVYGKFSPAMLMEYALTYNEELLEARASYKPIQPETEGVEYIPQERLTEALNGFIEQWEKELNAVDEKERAELRGKQLQGYAKLYNVDIDEIRKQFKKDAA